MKDDTRIKLVWSSLVFGGLWGLVEATLGLLLHQSLLPFTGLVLFPIGFLCMSLGVRASGGRFVLAPLYIACVAAGVKLIDFAVPGAFWMPIVNPAIAIVLEGLAVTAVLGIAPKLLKQQKLAQWVSLGLAASLSWRLAYVAILGVQMTLGLKIRLFQGGTEAVLLYLIRDGLINGLLLALIQVSLDSKALQSLKNMDSAKHFKGAASHPALGIASLMAALIITWVI